MTQEVKIWQIHDGKPQDLSVTRLDLESRLEDWLCQDIKMLDPALLIIGRQIVTDFGGRIDLLCLDKEGDTVIVELKRDKTPREIVAQALDYASWVTDLPDGRIREIATEHLNTESLELAFENHFGIPIPESLNKTHKIMIVASAVDASSERIIRYLSDTHGVNINAATFQYFQTTSGTELLSRVFLTTPSEVDYKARTRSVNKRRPNPSINDLLNEIKKDNLRNEIQLAIDLLKPLFSRVGTTLTTINFISRWAPDKSGTVINIIPGESSLENGLRFQLYARRFASLAKVPEDSIPALLPEGSIFWSYDSKGNPEWEGFTGYFRRTDIERLAEQIKNSEDQSYKDSD